MPLKDINLKYAIEEADGLLILTEILINTNHDHIEDLQQVKFYMEKVVDLLGRCVDGEDWED